MVDFEQDIKNCIAALSAGGVILYPTDTIWGLGCDATNAAAVQKIFDIKQRPANKSVIVLLAEGIDVLKYVAAPPPDIASILESFDRPTTVIYEAGLGFADGVTAENGSIGIRVTNDPFCKALIKRFQKPIVSTSANISNLPSPANFSEIDALVKQGVDYAVKYRQRETTPHQASRIVKLDDLGNITILRG